MTYTPHSGEPVECFVMGLNEHSGDPQITSTPKQPVSAIVKEFILATRNINTNESHYECNRIHNQTQHAHISACCL